MQIETGSLLVNKLRSLCDCVQKRLWIASPFIGKWTAVRKILGRRWVDEANAVVRLIFKYKKYFLNIKGGVNDFYCLCQSSH
jgi:hypothetical protein